MGGQWGNAEKARENLSTVWSRFFSAFSPSLRQNLAELALPALRIAFLATTLEAPPGFEPGVKDLQSSALTTWPWRLKGYLVYQRLFNANDLTISSSLNTTFWSSFGRYAAVIMMP